MSGSGASNLGYGNIVPYSNVNSSYVNVSNSHYPGGFGSNQIPGLPGLSGAKFNVDAAAARVPGICMSGGKKNLKRKIKNITKRYKMSKKSMRHKINSMKKKIKSITIGKQVGIAGGKRYKKTKTNKKRKRHRTRKGGNPMMLFRLGKYAKGKYSKKNEPAAPTKPEDEGNIEKWDDDEDKDNYQKGGYSQYQNNMPMTQTYSLGGHLSSENLGLANPPPYRVLSNDSSCVDNYNHFTNSGFSSRGH
jgi:hypothetical protein